MWLTDVLRMNVLDLFRKKAEESGIQPLVGEAPSPAGLEFCPNCLNPMHAWRTYADGTRECVPCSTIRRKR